MANETGSARRSKLHEKLLDAAEKAIASGGLPSLKAREIATAAGCSLGAIYNVFEDMDDLILCVGVRTLALLEASLTRALAEDGEGGGAADLIRLAHAYLRFARRHKLRWRALFEHRMADARPVPDWFIENQNRLFGLLEKPLSRLQPGLSSKESASLARSLFSAIHGIVTLGLEEKVTPMTASALDDQVEAMTRIFAAGLSVTHNRRA